MFGVQRGHDKMWYTDEKAIRSAWLIPGKVQGEPEVFIGSLTGPGIKRGLTSVLSSELAVCHHQPHVVTACRYLQLLAAKR